MFFTKKLRVVLCAETEQYAEGDDFVVADDLFEAIDKLERRMGKSLKRGAWCIVRARTDWGALSASCRLPVREWSAIRACENGAQREWVMRWF